MYQIERAIIMAAGTGTRMRPLTHTLPKPLIKVNGKPMIHSVIDALLINGITEIYVVVGHLKECFYSLPQAYPQVKLIENPYYNTCNNISSLYVARQHLKNTIILDGDQVIHDARILSKSFSRSGYNAIWTDHPTQEWLLTVNDGIISHCSRTGGEKGWQLFSISRWNEEDGCKLKRFLEVEFEEKKNTSIYWDDVALFCHPNAFTLGIQQMDAGSVQEIDSVDELIAADSSYSYLYGGTKK